ncbi:MAG: hypothetical protein RL368_1777 [Pseudomonadota bacterium]
MPTYYLRMEGVNLGAVFDDTNQVSVIRGASFLLREATQQLPKYILPKTWKVISSGASIGLFSFEAENLEQADKIKEYVVNHLNTNEKFRHFSFVVDIQPATQEFPYDKEAVLARNRFHQMQQLSLVVPEKNHSENSTTEICTLTNLTPAYKKEVVGKEPQFVSSSVKVRLKHGREQKQAFYNKETGVELDFTQSLQDIADSTGQLKNKIAVLYLDGNKFSSIQEKHCTTPDALQEFDSFMQGKRREFLTALLQDCIIPDKGFFNHDLVRLETLLWGGDEMLLVVPANKGLKLLQFFYEFTEGWEFEGNDLTHAGGLVFCRAKTPIRRIRKFAQELADAVKEKNRKENRFDYMVLESIDYPSESLEKLREKIFPDDLMQQYQVLKPFNSTMLGALQYLKQYISRTQAYGIAHAITNKDEAEFEEKRERLRVVLNDLQDAYNKKINTEIEEKLKCAFPEQIDPAFPKQEKRWQWLHLVELWDYIEESETSLTAPPTS